MDATGIQRRAGEAVGDLRTLGRRVTANPVAALLAAIAAGFLLGVILRLFERPRGEKK
jgi:hypothetical protein